MAVTGYSNHNNTLEYTVDIGHSFHFCPGEINCSLISLWDKTAVKGYSGYYNIVG